MLGARNIILNIIEYHVSYKCEMDFERTVQYIVIQNKVKVSLSETFAKHLEVVTHLGRWPHAGE